MHVTLTSRPSPDAATSSDFVVATANVVVMLDGVAVPPGMATHCVHDPAWFVRKLGAELVDILETHLDQDMSQSLAQAVVNVSALHMSTCQLQSSASPSARVAILRQKHQKIDYLLLGDMTVALDVGDGVHMVNGDRAERVSHSPVGVEWARVGAVDLPTTRRAVVLTGGLGRLVGPLDAIDWSTFLDKHDATVALCHFESVRKS